MVRWGFITLTLLSTVLALGAGASGSAEGRLAIRRIEVRVVRSTPPQVFVRVHAVVLDGCTHLDAVTQHRDANVVTVTIPTHTTGEVCTMTAQLVDQTIRLDGQFNRGSYTVNVNGVRAKFRV
jgi:predicted dinucleotide-binding enzyme